MTEPRMPEDIARRLLHQAAQNPALTACDDAWESAAVFQSLLDRERAASGGHRIEGPHSCFDMDCAGMAAEIEGLRRQLAALDATMEAAANDVEAIESHFDVCGHDTVLRAEVLAILRRPR